MSYQLKVIKDYPIGFWPLDESSGSIAADISGCGNNGTYVGSLTQNILPIIPGGVSGTKITNTSYITLPTSKDFYGSTVSNGLGNIYSSDNDFTLETWIHSSIISADLTPLLADLNNSIGLFYENGDIVFKVSSTEEIRWPIYYSKKTFHIVGIYSVSSMQLIVDGIIVANKNLNAFKFLNNSLDLQIGPTNNSSDYFIVDAPAVYRYSLPTSSIFRHFMDGNSTTQPIHVVHPEEGTLFTCTDSKNKVAYQYVYGVSKNWAELTDINTYYDEINKYITFYKSDTILDPKTFIIEDSFIIPSNIGLVTSKIEWRNDLGISVESSIDNLTWIQCTNGQPLPQYNKSSFDSSHIIYLRIIMATDDASKFLPRLSYFGIKFFTDTTVFADNFGDTITSTDDYYLGSLNYPLLSRNETNGIRPKSGTGFKLNTQSDIKAVELFFTPKSITATTLFYDPTSGTKFAWNGSGTVSKASVSGFYVNGVDRTSQTNISSFILAGEPCHIVLLFNNFVNGQLQFNYQTTGGDSHLYNNIAVYPRQLSVSEIESHFNLYTGSPSKIVTDPVITLTESAPKYYNNDWIVIQSV